MSEIKESSNNHIVEVDHYFSEKARQNVIKFNGQLVSPITITSPDTKIEEKNTSSNKGKD